ncbi:MAG: DNA recombination/repair protein RecA, partial [Planctomycetes bacterium]|nr:DNA recombination/repair protein RecA [Planctomycetota bacterium]
VTAKTKTTLIFINQIREKIGVVFGSPATTTGGRALKFYSSIRIDIRRIGTIKDGDTPIGARTKATVVKNKVAPPFKKCEFDILFAEGINRLGEMLDLGVEHGILRRSGTWLSHGETRLGQGRERAREFLKENPEVAEEILDQVLIKLGVRTDSSRVNPEAATAAGSAADKTASRSAPSRSSDARVAGAGGNKVAAGETATSSN